MKFSGGPKGGSKSGVQKTLLEGSKWGGPCFIHTRSCTPTEYLRTTILKQLMISKNNYFWKKNKWKVLKNFFFWNKFWILKKVPHKVPNMGPQMGYPTLCRDPNISFPNGSFLVFIWTIHTGIILVSVSLPEELQLVWLWESTWIAH